MLESTMIGARDATRAVGTIRRARKREIEHNEILLQINCLRSHRQDTVHGVELLDEDH